MELDLLRENIAKIIGVQRPSAPPRYTVIDRSKQDGYTRNLLEYRTDDDKIPAYLLIPDSQNSKPAVLINHQHNGERHLGKSEVCGLAGNPLQAFGPALTQRGFVVLSPDSICFEDRRIGATGTAPLPNDGDFLQHYNEMCYRILRGESLAKKVIEDAMQGISLLESLSFVDKNKIGALGHSYGGNTALFLSALDPRISYACASGSAVTYKNRIQNHTGIEMASVIPGFYKQYDIDDVIRCIAPRKLLLVSADGDKYSKDADCIIEQVLLECAKNHSQNNFYHKRYQGGHAMTTERFDFIINRFANMAM